MPPPQTGRACWGLGLRNDFKPIVTTLMSKFEVATAFFLKWSLPPRRVIANASFQDFQECQGITRGAFCQPSHARSPIDLHSAHSVCRRGTEQTRDWDWFLRARKKCEHFSSVPHYNCSRWPFVYCGKGSDMRGCVEHLGQDKHIANKFERVPPALAW